jgi:hypothetical protein
METELNKRGSARLPAHEICPPSSGKRNVRGREAGPPKRYSTSKISGLSALDVKSAQNRTSASYQRFSSVI